jgi:hypothetical protein
VIIDDNNFPVYLYLKLKKYRLDSTDKIATFLNKISKDLNSPKKFLLNWDDTTRSNKRSCQHIARNIYPIMKDFFESHFNNNDVFFTLEFENETYLMLQDKNRELPFFIICIKKDEGQYSLIRRPKSFRVTQIMKNSLILEKITKTFSTKNSKGKNFEKDK